MSISDDRTRTLIDELLEEQQRLTAVERFARKYESGAVPAQERYYRALLPTAKPEAGEQYAFGVDLDACTGCKACVSACHSLNGLDDDEVWRNVGVIHGGTSGAAYQQTITTACHHCVEPACMEGCPVKAYEKDAATGIVKHLDDQCIGCQYCVLKCPYDVPKYSMKKGIVRKCDMCSSRLAVGEAPACVQACPTAAISIRVVSKSAVTSAAAGGERLVPGAFVSEYTKPTTSYTTRKRMPRNAAPGDANALRLEHAHWPLIWMLVLTQIAAGLFLGASALDLVAPLAFAAASAPIAVVAFAFLNVGLAVSVLHLGRPLGAWRAFLGLRTSWMSREIAAFGLFAGMATVVTGAAMIVPAARWLPTGPLAAIVARASMFPEDWMSPSVHAAAVLAVLAVFCSAMIYVDTRRAFWSAPLVLGRFFGTSLLLGSAGMAAVLAWIGGPAANAAWWFAIIAAVVRTALFGWEAMHLRDGLADPASPIHRSSLLMWNRCRSLVAARAALFCGSTLFAVMAIAGSADAAAPWVTISFLLTAASQTIERWFFFTAVVAPRMPGGVAA